ncbi:MAG TPA: transcriptional repressor [Candidatus Gallacutalibacter pullicola]|uniref:Transcriptional repressor n=1 Tax=Candidatus Gallacutalibacter pullicola TaxID=2840830 RepID=A0A9D1J0S7_9FIRM|nr:transcriptional repressor [Candidatus Gallacutalibacter pullicola]
MKRQNFSRKREAILRTICETEIHPAAEWVYQKLKLEYPDLSLGTVYRNIAKFKEEGSIVCVGVVNGQERLDGNVSPHAHFICRSCGAVLDLPKDFLPQESGRRAEEAFGHKVETCALMFYGVCAGCLQKSQTMPGMLRQEGADSGVA